MHSVELEFVIVVINILLCCHVYSVIFFSPAFVDCGLLFDSRYCEGVDSIHHFQVTLIDNILVKLLWQDYTFFVSLNNQDKVFSGISADSSENSDLPSNEKKVETLTIKYPMRYLRDLGECIIGILSGISLVEHDLLSAFTVEFQETCLVMLQQTEDKERSTARLERVTHFISLLEQHAIHRGENWLLVDLVGPMLVKSFPLIRSIVSYYCPNSSDWSKIENTVYLFYFCGNFVF